jgi:hypothetical protein
VLTTGTIWLPLGGCKPKPPKIPSGQIQPRHDRIQVYDLPAVAKVLSRLAPLTTQRAGLNGFDYAICMMPIAMRA